MAEETSPESRIKAVMLFEDACKQGEGSACVSLGTLYRDGDIVQKDAPRAVGLFEQACDIGVARGCTHRGYHFEHGIGVQADFDAGSAPLRTACEEGDPQGCSYLGSLYARGDGVIRARAARVACSRKVATADTISPCERLGCSTELRVSAPQHLHHDAVFERRDAVDSHDALVFGPCAR